MPARKRVPPPPRRDADDDLDNDVIGTPLPTRSVPMDRGSPVPGEPGAYPDPDRLAAIDEELAERHRPADRVPPPAMRDNTRALPRGSAGVGQGDVDLGRPGTPREIGLAMLSDRAADKAGRDMDDAVARRNKRIGRRP